MYAHVLPEASSCLTTMYEYDYSGDTAEESYIPKPGVKSEVWNYFGLKRVKTESRLMGQFIAKICH